MGDDSDLVRLGDGRDLFRPGKAAAHADADPQVVQRLALHQHLVLLGRVDALAGGQRDADLLGHPGHGVEVVRQNRVLIEHGQQGLQLGRQGHGFRRV